MPTLDDLPTLASLANPSGGDFIPVFDSSAPGNGPSKVRKLGVNSVLGLAAADVTLLDSGTTSATVSTRLTIGTSTSAITLTLPPASGDLREVIIMKASATSAITVNRAGTDVIVTGTSTTATSISVPAGLAASLLSDGTKWYHISNDA